ncbi:MAG TPA: CDC48 family AAA ATPase [Candidatus Nanoarchaeia archaeon]|nr:CDC48 family AAA ATPase [Candidatus Nanoarchaeia archaeon]
MTDKKPENNKDKEKNQNKEEYKPLMELKVVESLQEDIDKGIARIPSKIMNDLDIVSGDIIEIKGKNKGIVKAMRSIKSDEGREIIRLDGTIRSNVGVSIGDKTSIAKTDIKEAKKVTLSPLQEVRFSDDPTEYFHTKLLHYPLNMNQKIVIDVFGNRLGYVVTNLSPKGKTIVTPATKIVVSDEKYTGEEAKATGVSYEDIGGLKDEVAKVREMVELPMKHPEIFEKLGVGAPKGVLMTGPPGTGKTLLAKAVANETDSSFYSINGPEIMSKYYGESEKHIRETFEKAQKNSPAIIFFDEIDSIAPKRGEGTDQTEKRIVSQLLSLMDGLKSRGQVVVMAATNRPDDIDPALRRPGRFDRELKINPPTEGGRKEILQIHTRGMPLGKNVNFDEISRKTIGYTGADIEALCKEAGLKAIKPHFSELKNIEEKVPTDILDKIQVTRENFIESLKQIEPSAMREVLINKPHVRWSDIGGLTDAKEKLRELVELPLMRPDLYSKAGINPSKGILLHGPPGTGKTMLAKAVATEANANFISVKGPELMSKWVGESEKRVREIFKKAKEVAPTIIFFDEFDSISKQRGGGMNDATEKVVNQLLSEMDGVEELEKVMVIAATNRKDLVDPALLRPGRIDANVELKVPDKKTREQIFQVHTKKMPLSKEVNVLDYVSRTENWTGAEIEALTRNAGINAIKRIYKSPKKQELKINKQDFDQAIKTVSESVDKPISGEDKKQSNGNQEKKNAKKGKNTSKKKKPSSKKSVKKK